MKPRSGLACSRTLGLNRLVEYDGVLEGPVMPLRDHFHAPLDNRFSWEGLHGQWPAMIVQSLSRTMPPRYFAAPRIHWGNSVEIDVATFEEEEPDYLTDAGEGNGGATLATAIWAPPRPTLAIATSLPDEYEVKIYDTRRGRRLVAAIEIVSPSNKDRPESRRAFVAKCASLLQDQVCVVVVDLVTSRHFNLYSELLELFSQTDPALANGTPSLYAVACRWPRGELTCVMETWSHSLELGQPLPTLPRGQLRHPA